MGGLDKSERTIIEKQSSIDITSSLTQVGQYFSPKQNYINIRDDYNDDDDDSEDDNGNNIIFLYLKKHVTLATTRIKKCSY